MYKSFLMDGLRFFLVFFGIVIMTGILSMFMNGLNLNLQFFITNIIDIIKSIIHPNKMVTDDMYPVFPSFWNYYFYSVIIFISSLLLAILASLILSILTFLLPQGIFKRIIGFTSFLESTPDIFIIYVIQFCVIWIFKNTGILLFPIAGAFEPAYFLPIITLSILPTILFYRITLLMVNEEEKKSYVSFARSKGLNLSSVFYKHVLRNVLLSVANHSKSIIWIMLSNLVMFERLFNVYGITYYIFANAKMDIIAISLIMLYIPIFILLLALKIFLGKFTGNKVVI